MNTNVERTTDAERTPVTDRLFSNLRLADNRLHHQPGSLIGCTALVAGTTVGAGVLALPAVTLPSGVLPSTVLLIGVWLYALASGLLLAEVNLHTMRSLGRPESGLLAMVEHALGKPIASVAAAAYLFLHYALLVAYLAEGGQILTEAIAAISSVSTPLPRFVGPLLFALMFGGLVYLGQHSLVQQLNNLFVAIVLASFIGLLGLGVGAVEPSHFLHQDWAALSPAISVMLVTLFYHNVIPVITTQLEGDVEKIRRSILVGSLIPLGMFLLWNAVILGSVSPDLLPSGDTLVDPLQVLRSGNAGAGLGVFASLFSEFAIATSFIGFVYGLVDFFIDAWKTVYDDRRHRLRLYSLVLLPPMSLSALNPDLFVTAIDCAGTFSISVLGGIIPALAAWKQRDLPSYPSIRPLVPGGKLMLLLLIAVAVLVIGQQVSR